MSGAGLSSGIPYFCGGDLREEERGHRRNEPAQGGGESRDVLEFLRLVGGLIRDPADHRAVQPEIAQFTVAQRSQLAEGLFVQAAASEGGAERVEETAGAAFNAGGVGCECHVRLCPSG